MLSLIVPVLNGAGTLPAVLDAAMKEPVVETILVDGGSRDRSADVAATRGATVLWTARGRGTQLAAGVAAARSPWLLLLHADTVLAPAWAAAAAEHMRACPGQAGYFRFALASGHPRARVLERRVAWRSRALGLPYGDQGLLLHRDLLAAVGGVAPLPLMEDVDLARRLGRRRLCALDAAAVTSAEKWERDGWRRRSARNLACLTLYFAGVPPRAIARLYG